MVVFALQAAYGTAEFTLYQCTNKMRTIRRDVFFIEFVIPPNKLVRKLPLEPSKMGGGSYQALMTPVDLTSKCKNSTCELTVHGGVGWKMVYASDIAGDR